MPRPYCFIATKPLQILVALAVADQLNSKAAKHLVITDSFMNSSDIYERAKVSLTAVFNQIKYQTIPAAYDEVGKQNYSRLFIDSDVGMRRLAQLMFLKVRRPKTRIYVYEEGIGTYRGDLYSSHRRAIVSFFGAGTHFGGCILTAGIYLFKPELYQQRFKRRPEIIKRIKLSIPELIRKFDDELSFLFSLGDLEDQLHNSKSEPGCILYLSSWDVDHDVLRQLAAQKGPKIFKPHPHVREPPAPIPANFLIVDGSLPAEILIPRLLIKFGSVRIFHHGSSVASYIDLPNVEFQHI